MKEVTLQKVTMTELTFREIDSKMTEVFYKDCEIMKLACPALAALYLFWEALGDIDLPIYILREGDVIVGIYFGPNQKTQRLEHILVHTPHQKITLLSAPMDRQVRGRK